MDKFYKYEYVKEYRKQYLFISYLVLFKMFDNKNKYNLLPVIFF